MTCEHLHFKKHGFVWKTRIQRYRCLDCGRSLIDPSERKVNRLPKEKYDKSVKLLKAGESRRSVARNLRISPITVYGIAQRSGLSQKSSPLRKRDRRNYLKEYEQRQTRNQYERALHQWAVRAHIALWLAKNEKPQGFQQIYAAMKAQFSDLSENSLRQMLNLNTDGVFKKVGEKYAYMPFPFWLSFEARDGTKDKSYNVLTQARRTYFQRIGKDDEYYKIHLEKKEREEKIMVLAAIETVQPQLKMLASMHAIATYGNKLNGS